jgi:hypothetical protein
MRKMPRAKAMLVIGAVVAVLLAGPASALIGHLPFGGSDRDGYKHSALLGTDLFGGSDRDGYEQSALAGHVTFGGYERGGYEFS